MRLYCYVCTLGGTRLHEHAIIALFDPENIRLPLSGEMFESPMPDRGIPAPWLPGTPYDEMNHNGHSPFGVKPEDALRCRDQGGPDALLTEHSWLPLSTDGLKEPVAGVVRPYDELTHEDLDAEWYARLVIKQMQRLRKDGMSHQAIGDLVDKSREWVRKKLIEAGE